jgi:phospholipid transport system substrate-binding protein
MHTLYCHRRSVMAATAALFIGATIPAGATDDAAVIAPIQQLVDSLLKVMKAGAATPFSQRYNILAPVTVATYVNNCDGFDGQRFVIAPTTRAVGNEQVVQTRIIPKTGDSHELDYVMREGGSGWRAVDVLADGTISRVAVQRSDFRRLMARGGPQALADSLRSKSVDLSDGSS